MKQLFPDLWQTPLEMRFGTLKTHAYMLEHGAGRDLIYVAEDPDTLTAINVAGGVGHIYMSHNHEITSGLERAQEKLGAKLAGHARMQPRFPQGRGLDIAFETGQAEMLPSGLEVIFTPGHTDNNVCYRFESPHGKTYLFTGDTIYLDNGEWNTLVMRGDGGDPADLRRSLEMLCQLDVDVAITSVAVGDDQIVEVDRPGWKNTMEDLSRALAR